MHKENVKRKIFKKYGILDQIAVSLGISVARAGQLITVFALGNAIGTPIIIAATAKLNQ